jgi:hypothetical protein
LFALYATRGTFSRNAIHWPDIKKSIVRMACVMFSGRTNYIGEFRYVGMKLKVYALG